jgi:hypothetical protein
MTEQPTERRKDKRNITREYRAEILAKLDQIDAFTETVQVPRDFLPALMAGRPELLKIAQPRDMTAAEVKQLYDLIGVLVETNMALREHAHEVAKLTHNLLGGFTAVQSAARQIDHFANFRAPEDDADDDA